MLSILTIRRFQPILLAIAALLLLPGLRVIRAADEQPAEAKPTKSASDRRSLLLTAMQDNPDVLVAESEVYEAEADLERVELDVVRKVVAAKAELHAKQLEVRYTIRLNQSKAVSDGEVQLQKSKLPPLEADLKYLIGMRSDLPAEKKDVTDHVEGENKPAAESPAKPADDVAFAAEIGVDVLVGRALANNPDIHLAKARLNGSRAELNRTRLDAARRCTALMESIKHLRARVDSLRESVKAGTSEEASLLDVMAKLAADQAELEYVLGRPRWADVQKGIEQSSPKPDEN